MFLGRRTLNLAGSLLGAVPVRPTLCLLLLGPSTLTSADPVTGWVSLFDPQNNSPRFVAGTAATGSPVTTDADQDCIAANFPSITLADGDSITLRGTVSIDVSLAGGHFRIGLFSGPAVQQDVGNPYVGLYTEAPTGTATGLKFGNGTHPDHAFGSGTVVSSAFLPGGTGVAANTPIDFVLTITRDGAALDVASSYTDRGSYTRSGSVDNLPILNAAPNYAYTFNTAGFLFGGSMNGNRATFSNIAVTRHGHGPTDTDGDGMPHLFGVDFNRDDAFGSPSQSLFRIVSGSTTQSGNATSYTKAIGSYQVTASQPNGTKFEFRGANTDPSRAIPGGDTSLSFLVADFIATREGALDLTITGLAAGNYVFRSWHLDTLTASTLGYAQGASTTTPNTIEARLGGVVQASVQPTALGSSGLGTTFIDDGQIPSMAFGFTHDGSAPLTVELRSTMPNGGDNFLLLNGFELFHHNP